MACLLIEINSTTDNPIIDHENNRSLHAGNFQAATLSLHMDSLRLHLYAAAKMIFAQHSELVNITMSQGLPPNLCWNDPATDFGHKGIDIAMASYVSELGQLAQPAITHVQSAELHNQSVNSLALISARLTQQMIDILNMMVSCHLYACCQAADLRAFEKLVRESFRGISEQACKAIDVDSAVDDVEVALAAHICANQGKSWEDRIHEA
ncbi:hypothetical protein HDV05_001227, partial [Chytridiales sp. JEL 0842]